MNERGFILWWLSFCFYPSVHVQKIQQRMDSCALVLLRRWRKIRENYFACLFFLKRTKGRVLRLRPHDMKLLADTDAAFASHFDANSHTGVAFFWVVLWCLLLRESKSA